jgi:hypothetical protein
MFCCKYAGQIYLQFVNNFFLKLAKKIHNKFFQFVNGLFLNNKKLPKFAIMDFGVNPRWQGMFFEP